MALSFYRTSDGGKVDFAPEQQEASSYVHPYKNVAEQEELSEDVKAP